MALIEDRATTETAAERNARLQAAFNKASTSTKTTTSAYVPAPSYTEPPAVPRLEGPLSWTPPSIPQLPYQDERQYDLSSRYGTQQATDISQRQYTIPQFGERPSDLGLGGTLNRQQLAEAARLTGDAMFTYGQLPSVISSDVANELPYNPTSQPFQDMMMESFGVPGFETSDEFLTQLGYYEYEEGKWEILDPITVTGYGDGVYQSGGTSTRGGGGYSPSRGYSQGGSLVNWRIGF